MAKKNDRLNIRRRIIDTIGNKDISWVQAAREIGVARPTLYSWCGKNSFVPPALEFATPIARFIDEDSALVRYTLLLKHGDITQDEYDALLSHRLGLSEAERIAAASAPDDAASLHTDAEPSFGTSR